MGKYIKKSKIVGDVSVKGITHQTTFDCRTRAAKNLALLRLRSHSHEAESFRYLQLRSRRLVKLPLLPDSRKQQKQHQQQHLTHGVNECRMSNPNAKSGPAKKTEAKTTVLVTEIEEDCGDNEGTFCSDCNFGEKPFDFESGDRETTQCSNLIRDSKAIQSVVPSSHEIEDFFAYAEQQQSRFFTEKYNFDIVSENPLPGRYEWVKVMP